MKWRASFLLWVLIFLLGWTLLIGAANSAKSNAVVPLTPYPELPAFVSSVYGPVRVIIKPNLTFQGDSLYGMWHPDIRTIFVRDSLAPWLAYGVLQHEICHVAISDADIELPESVEEAVCNAIARQRSVEAWRHDPT